MQCIIHANLSCVCFQVNLWKSLSMHAPFLSMQLHSKTTFGAHCSCNCLFCGALLKGILTVIEGTEQPAPTRPNRNCCNPPLLPVCLFCRRRCQSRPPQWRQPSQGPASLLGGEDGGEGPVEQQDRVYSVSRRLHHRPGQHVALSLPLLQEWRRWVEDEGVNDPKTLNPKTCIGSINSLVHEFKTTLVHFYNQPCSIHLSAPFMTH